MPVKVLNFDTLLTNCERNTTVEQSLKVFINDVATLVEEHAGEPDNHPKIANRLRSESERIVTAILAHTPYSEGGLAAGGTGATGRPSGEVLSGPRHLASPGTPVAADPSHVGGPGTGPGSGTSQGPGFADATPRAGFGDGGGTPGGENPQDPNAHAQGGGSGSGTSAGAQAPNRAEPYQEGSDSPHGADDRGRYLIPGGATQQTAEERDAALRSTREAQEAQDQYDPARNRPSDQVPG